MSNAKDLVLPDEFQYCLITLLAFAAILLLWIIVKFATKSQDLNLPIRNQTAGKQVINIVCRWECYYVLTSLFSFFAGIVSVLILWERENGDIVDVEVSS